MKRKKISEKLLSLLLAVVMLISMIPMNAFAAELPFTLSYKVGQDTTIKTASATEIGTMSNSTVEYDKTAKVYLVELPYGSTVTSYSNENATRTTYGSSLESASGSIEQIAGQYIKDEQMTAPSQQNSYKTFLDYIDVSEKTIPDFKDSGVTGFSIYSTAFGQKAGCMVIVQISTVAPNTVPVLANAVKPTAEASVVVNTPYSIDLSTIFSDSDSNDTLTYKVKIDDALYVDTSKNYEYTPTKVGNTTLVFKASDGKSDSSTYTVTLTVTEKTSDSNGDVPEPKPVFTVHDTSDKEYKVSKIEDVPTTYDSGKFNTSDGFYTVTVPKGTENLKLDIGKLKNIPDEPNPEKYIYFAKWEGSTQSLTTNTSAGTTKICNISPSLFEDGYYAYGVVSYEGYLKDDLGDLCYDTPYSNGCYTLPLDKFKCDTSKFSSLQKTIYGKLDDNCEYAQILLGTVRKGGFFDFDGILLVKFEDPSYLTGPAHVQLTDGTDVEMKKLPDVKTLTNNGVTYPFDQKSGFYKLVVPEGTTSIKLKLNDSLFLPEGVTDPKNCYYIGKRGQFSISNGTYTLLLKLSNSRKFYASEEALKRRLINNTSLASQNSMRGMTITDAVDEDGWFTLPLSEFSFDPSDDDSLEFYNGLDSTKTFSEIQLESFADKSTYNFGAMLLIQMGGNADEEGNNAPTRKAGVPQTIQVDLTEKDYTLDLSTIFEDKDEDNLTYKYMKKTDSDWTEITGNTVTLKGGADNPTYIFTANDGKVDGKYYTVTLKSTLLGLIKLSEDIISDDTNYWKENDFCKDPKYTSYPSLKTSYYKIFTTAYDKAKAYYDAKGDYILPVSHGISSASNAYEDLSRGIKSLMPKSKLNASRIYYAYVNGNKAITEKDKYTPQTLVGLVEAVNDVNAVYSNTLYQQDYDATLQSTLDKNADKAIDILTNLVETQNYKDCYNRYREKKSEAEGLLAQCDLSKYISTDYTEESYQAFLNAYNVLKADLEYKIQGEGGTSADYKMVSQFVNHMNDLSTKRNNLVSDKDITISFSYINNFGMLNPKSNNKNGTDVYKNTSMSLIKGSSTLKGAVETAGIVFDDNTIMRPNPDHSLITDGETANLLLYINGEYIGVVGSNELTNVRNTIQLHDKDNVELVRIPALVVKGETSSGYDTTSISYSKLYDPIYCSDSISQISITNKPADIKIGDKAAFEAAVTNSYVTNKGNKVSPQNLSLYVSGPSQTEEYSQDLQKTASITDENGKVTYVFSQPGWYTVALLNSQTEEYGFGSVYGSITEGKYGSLYAGDFALVYVAPSENESALISTQRENNLSDAKAFYDKYHDYDFTEDKYEQFKGLYTSLVDNLNGATKFKDLVDNYNSDYAAMTDFVKSNALNHDEILQDLHKYLAYFPYDLTKVDFTYRSILTKLQNIYGSLNDYEKNYLTKNEIDRLDSIAAIDKDNLYTPTNISISVLKDSNVTLPNTSGNLASAPNQNKVMLFYPNGTLSQGYYRWRTCNTDMEPSCEGMTAYPGNQISIRRVITQSDDNYWLVYSLDNGTTWNLFSAVNNGDSVPRIMLDTPSLIVPQVKDNALNIKYKAISKADYESIKSSSVTFESTLEQAKSDYKASIIEVFNSYKAENYTEDNFVSVRDAKNNGIDSIESAKTINELKGKFNVAIANMASVPKLNRVRVTVKNDTYTKAQGAVWDGVLVDELVDINSESTMMGCIKTALEKHGFTGEGFDSGYISSINGLGEFGGGSGSGWMGTLNDWFTNEGFSQFTVANDKLHSGDNISIEYTCNLGADIRGGVDGSDDTSLFTMNMTNGNLTPAFDKSKTSYMFTLDENSHSTMLDFSANNRAFQARAYLNDYNPSSTKWIASGDTVPLKKGDIIYIGVGERSWESMGKSDPTVYKIIVVDDNGTAETLINNLPNANALKFVDKADVDKAKAVYESLSSSKKDLISSELKQKLTECVDRMAVLEKEEQAINFINELPEASAITIDNLTAVNNVKSIFEQIGTKGKDDIPIKLLNKFTECEKAMDEILSSIPTVDVEKIIKDTSNHIYNNVKNPVVASIGGEWAVLGLSRSNYKVGDDYYNKYIANVIAKLKDKDGVLDSRKYTEYSRVILALTSIGVDVTDVGGYNLITPLANYDKVIWQGINGPIFALIALDSHNYDIPETSEGTQTTRENLIKNILDHEIQGGGWAMSGKVADPDITAMAIQGLAPYYSKNNDVKNAVDRALSKLSSIQADNGGYSSWGTTNSESCAQVIVALTSMGIDPQTDSRFIKNGNTVLSALSTFYVENGGFRHTMDGDLNDMATEQGYYAFVAYNRFKNSQKSLYDMTEVNIISSVDSVKSLINAIGTVTLDSENALNGARTAYDSLNQENKNKVDNYSILVAAENSYKSLKAEEAKKNTPKILNGSDQTVKKGENLTIRSSAELKDFISVTINGVILDPSNYVLSEGSTIVTLKQEYLNTLKPGTYTISINSTTGSAVTSFKMDAAVEPDNNKVPAEDDNQNNPTSDSTNQNKLPRNDSNLITTAEKNISKNENKTIGTSDKVNNPETGRSYPIQLALFGALALSVLLLKKKK